MKRRLLAVLLEFCLLASLPMSSLAAGTPEGREIPPVSLTDAGSLPAPETGESGEETPAPGESAVPEPSAAPSEVPEPGEETPQPEGSAAPETTAAPSEVPEIGAETPQPEESAAPETSAAPWETPEIGEETPAPAGPGGTAPAESAAPETTAAPAEGEAAPEGERRTYAAQVSEGGPAVTAVLAPETILPPDAQLRGEALGEDDPGYETAAGSVYAALGTEAARLLLYDLYFTSPETGERVEPEGGPLRITLTFPGDPFGEAAPAETPEAEEATPDAETADAAPEAETTPETTPEETAEPAPAARRFVLRILEGGAETVEAQWAEDNTSVTFTADSLSPVGLALVSPEPPSAPIASETETGEKDVIEVPDETKLKEEIGKATAGTPVILKLAQEGGFWINNTITVDGKDIILVASKDSEPYTVNVNVSMNGKDKQVGFEIKEGGSLTIGLPGGEYGELNIKAHNGNASSLIKCGEGCALILNSGILDGNHQARGVLVNGGTFTMNGGTIQNGKVEQAGGAVHVSNKGGVFNLKGGTIKDCTAGNGGGVSLYKKATFTMTGGTITNCTAGSNGGGVYVDEEAQGPAPVAISGGTISNCSAHLGGGIYVGYESKTNNSKATLAISGGTIENCTASQANGGKGGGVYFKGQTFTFSGGTVTGCTATETNGSGKGQGGGLYVVGSPLTFSGGSVANCTASGSGGGVYMTGSPLTLSGGSVSGCTASNGPGGGLYIEGSGAAMSGGDIINCAGISGGGLYVGSAAAAKADAAAAASPAATLTISGGNIENCSATQTTGGGVYFKGQTFTFSGGTISGCTANGTKDRDDGGGIYVTGPEAELVMSGGTVTACTAHHRGGGVYFAQGKKFALSAGAVTNCTAQTGEGGGMFIYKIGEFTMTGGDVSGNTALYQGGGIFLYNNGQNATATDARYSINAGRITGNKLTNSEGLGGGIFVDKGITLQLYNTLVTGNTATLLGGGLWACQTGDIKVYVTDGGAIFDNAAGSPGSSAAAGDDVAFVASFLNAKSILTLYKNMLGGGLNQYYKDGGITYGLGEGFFGFGAGIPTDHPPRYGEDYQVPYDKTENLTGFNAIKNVPTGDAKDGARGAAALVISGNTAGRGGGIGTNGNLVIGTPEETYSVTILKKWSDDTPEEKKTPVSVYLKIDGEALGPFTLSAENDWTVTIDGLTSDPATVEYAVAEDPVPEGFRPVYQGAVVVDHTITLEFTNQYLTGSLTVKKTVTGNGGDRQKEFHFRVELSDTGIDGQFGEMLFTDGVAEFTLKDGESKTAVGLPSGITYTVTEVEANQDGYTTTPAGDTGTIPEDGEVTAEFVNERITGSLTVKKTVTGNGGDRQKEFHFRVELSDTGIDGQFGEMLFTDGVAEFTLKDGESKTATGLPSGITYTVTEAEANQDGYTTTPAGGTGAIPEDGEVTVEFVNDKPITPLTGDHSHFDFWFALTAAAALGVLFTGLTLLRGRGKGGYRGRHVRG